MVENSKTPLLDSVRDPADIREFSVNQLKQLAKELRDDTVRFLGDEYASFSTPADWHPDMPSDTPYESLKFGFYLDDLSRGRLGGPGGRDPKRDGDHQRRHNQEA